MPAPLARGPGLPQVHASLTKLLAMAPEEVEALGLTFEVGAGGKFTGALTGSLQGRWCKVLRDAGGKFTGARVGSSQGGWWEGRKTPRGGEGAGGRWRPLVGAGRRLWALAAAGGRWRPLVGAGGRWRALAAAGGRWRALVGGNTGRAGLSGGAPCHAPGPASTRPAAAGRGCPAGKRESRIDPHLRLAARPAALKLRQLGRGLGPLQQRQGPGACLSMHPAPAARPYAKVEMEVGFGERASVELQPQGAATAVTVLNRCAARPRRATRRPAPAGWCSRPRRSGGRPAVPPASDPLRPRARPISNEPFGQGAVCARLRATPPRGQRVTPVRRLPARLPPALQRRRAAAVQVGWHGGRRGGRCSGQVAAPVGGHSGGAATLAAAALGEADSVRARARSGASTGVFT
jgi:hypothetical protein